jgi:uncharacterized repeat protein (TIGR01451 family)
VVYSAPAPVVDSGKNYSDTDPFPIIAATPFTWTVDSGKLPPGLSLASAGEITGTPTATGTFNFTMKLVDSTGLTATQAQTITIAGGCPPVIDKEADSPTVTAGGLAGFRITVANRGRVTAHDWWVCDRIPRHMTFVRASRKLRRLGSLRCLVVNTLRPHHHVSFHITLRVAANAPNGTETNIGEVIPGPPAGTPEPPPGTPEHPTGSPAPPNAPPTVEVPIKKTGSKVIVRHPVPVPPPLVTG